MELILTTSKCFPCKRKTVKQLFLKKFLGNKNFYVLSTKIPFFIHLSYPSSLYTNISQLNIKICICLKSMHLKLPSTIQLNITLYTLQVGHCIKYHRCKDEWDAIQALEMLRVLWRTETQTNNCYSEGSVTSKRRSRRLEFFSSQAIASREAWFAQWKEPFSHRTLKHIFTFFILILTPPNDTAQNDVN